MTSVAKRLDKRILYPIELETSDVERAERFNKAFNNLLNYKIQNHAGGFFITSDKGFKYLTRLSTFQSKGSCTCKDFKTGKNIRRPCKHIYMILMKFTKVKP